MGMSASQARFLGLTARKSNVEYEGQQVNQQRTMLANKASVLNNQMLSLSVPVPPDINSYYSEQYVFTDGDKECEIISGLDRPSMIVQESEKKYDVFSQKCNNGSPVIFSFIDDTLSINGMQMTLLKAQASKKQIEAILNNGTAGNEPPFMCKVDGEDPFISIDDNQLLLSDPKTIKYTNDFDKVNVPLEEGSEFQENYEKGVPSYALTQDDEGNSIYTKLTDDNYEELMLKAANSDDVVIVQEKRDEDNQPTKVVVNQSECNKISGLPMFAVKANTDDTTYATHSYTEYDPETHQGVQQFLPTVQTSKEDLQNDEKFMEQLDKGDTLVYQMIFDDDAPGGVKYEHIDTLEEFNALDNESIILQVDESATSIMGIPISDEEATKYGFKTYVLTEKVAQFEDETFALTQEMWDEAKANNDVDLMNYYLDNLDFDGEYAANNMLYYYTKDSSVRYIQQSYTKNIQEEGDTDTVTIPQEYYELAYDDLSQQTYENCVWQKNESNGRFVNVTATTPNGDVKTFSLEFTKVQDEQAYEQAMLDYEYNKAEYDKKVADINAQTEDIQAQDKALELRLRALDTEQEAVTKEMEAVKKVINTNIEKSFDTFS